MSYRWAGTQNFVNSKPAAVVSLYYTLNRDPTKRHAAEFSTKCYFSDAKQVPNPKPTSAPVDGRQELRTKRRRTEWRHREG